VVDGSALDTKSEAFASALANLKEVFAESTNAIVEIV
jgi:hypothetical protein